MPQLSAILFLSTPSVRRATNLQDVVTEMEIISIHALREEGDSMPSPALILPGVFLSTPSVRRATPFRSASCRRSAYFYPRPP